MAFTVDWRGPFTNDEVNALHAEAFRTRRFEDDWLALTARWSLGWVVARDADGLVGFVNVLTDGQVHAWLQDTMVAARVRHQGVATRIVAAAREGARAGGCDYLHVDFDDDVQPFYQACGFTPSAAGVMRLQP